MPLFMDLHIIEGITIDEVKKAHVADKAVEEKHNVKLHQFWVNEEVGTVICLMEAPDKKSCEAVHQEAHGNIACKVEEVEPGYYQLFMGRNHQIDQGLVRHKDGKVDLGYRFVLVVYIRCNMDEINSCKFKLKSLIPPPKVRKFVLNYIKDYRGKEANISDDDNIIAVFKESKNAVACAVALQKELAKKSSNPEDPEWDILFKMGVAGGQPLTEEKGFFEEVIRVGQRLSITAGNQKILISPLIKKMSGQDKASADSSIRIVNTSDSEFLNNLFDVVEENTANQQFGVDSLSREMGMSRSQLYRKTKSVTGRSPNTFIRDLRMRKALALIREQKYNISEISLKVGITNPSYFSKCFHDKYGIVPSKVHS